MLQTRQLGIKKPQEMKLQEPETSTSAAERENKLRMEVKLSHSQQMGLKTIQNTNLLEAEAISSAKSIK